MCPAIHINSRSWLRSSSTHEPSDPPPKVVFVFRFSSKRQPVPSHSRQRLASRQGWRESSVCQIKQWFAKGKNKIARGRRGQEGRRRSLNLRQDGQSLRTDESPPRRGVRCYFRRRRGTKPTQLSPSDLPQAERATRESGPNRPTSSRNRYPTSHSFSGRRVSRSGASQTALNLEYSPSLSRVFLFEISFRVTTSNDPSAGSPTETLLRLLLPLNDQVRASSRPAAPPGEGRAETNPRPSLNRSIGSSDGRCVQRAGT